jgi:hypothetical protein
VSQQLIAAEASCRTAVLHLEARSAPNGVFVLEMVSEHQSHAGCTRKLHRQIDLLGSQQSAYCVPWKTEHRVR